MSMFRIRPSWQRSAAVVVVAAAAVVAGGLAGCSELSQETKDVGVAAICTQIEVEPGEIENNPEAARLVALIVRDLAPEENIRDIAGQVANDPNALNPRVQLAEWVDQKCRR